MKNPNTLITFLSLCGTSGLLAVEVVADFNDMNAGAMMASNGQPANTGTGFLDAHWDANTSLEVIHLTDLSVSTPGYTVTQGGTPKKFGPSASIGTNQRQQARTMQTLSGSNIWFSYLVSKPTTAGRAGIGFNQGAGELPNDPRLVWLDDQMQFRVGGATLGTSALTSTASTVLVIGRIQPNAGGAGEDHLSVWVNPANASNIASLGAPSISVTSSNWISDAPTIRDIHPQCYGASGANAPYLDSIRLSDEGDAFLFVTGRSGDPTLAVASTSPAANFAFGDKFAPAPLTTTRTMRFKNEGTTQDISIQGLNITNNGGGTFQLVSPPPTPFTVLPGQTFDVTVQASTSVSGTTLNGSLTIDTDEDTAINQQDRVLPLSVRLNGSGQIMNTNPTFDTNFTGWNIVSGGTAVSPGIRGPQGVAMRLKGTGDPTAGAPDHFGQVLPAGGDNWELVYWVSPIAKDQLERYVGFPPDGGLLDRSMQTLVLGNGATFPANGGVLNSSDTAKALINLAYFPDGIVSGGAEGFYVFDGVSGWMHLPTLGTIAGSIDVDSNGIPLDGIGDKGDGILSAASGDTVNAYQIRIKGNGFGSPGATFDISVSQANSLNIAGTATGLTFYDQLNITSSTPSTIVHTTGDTTPASGVSGNGASTSFWVDDTYYYSVAAATKGIEIASGPQALAHAAPTGTGTFKVRNHGLSSNLNVGSISFSDPGFTVISPVPPFAVAPDQSQEVTVQFAAASLGAATAVVSQMTVNSDDPNHPATLVPAIGGKSTSDNLIPNWNFEVAGTSPATDAFAWWWETGTPANVKKVPGLIAGSSSAASLGSVGGFGQVEADLGAPAAAASVEAVFAIKNTTARAFNMILHDDSDSLGQINLRYEGGIWSVFGGTPAAWQTAINMTANPLTPSVDANGNGSLDDPGDTKVPYRLKIVSSGWGTGLTYTIQVMNAAGTVLGTSSPLNFTQSAVPDSPLGLIVFTPAFGSSPGFWVDDVLVSAVTASPGVTITGFTKNGGTATITWDSGGAAVVVQRSGDLLEWQDISTANTMGTYTDFNAPADRAFYRVVTE